MLKRYAHLREYISEIDIEDDVDLLTQRDERKVDSLVTKYCDLDAVTKELQKDELTCADVRSLFDAVISDYPASRLRLAKNADRLVHNSVFERALVKIQNVGSSGLGPDEAKMVECLLIEPNNESEAANDTNCGLVERGKNVGDWRWQVRISIWTKDLLCRRPTSANGCFQKYSTCHF